MNTHIDHLQDGGSATGGEILREDIHVSYALTMDPEYNTKLGWFMRAEAAILLEDDPEEEYKQKLESAYDRIDELNETVRSLNDQLNGRTSTSDSDSSYSVHRYPRGRSRSRVSSSSQCSSAPPISPRNYRTTGFITEMDEDEDEDMEPRSTTPTRLPLQQRFTTPPTTNFSMGEGATQTIPDLSRTTTAAYATHTNRNATAAEAAPKAPRSMMRLSNILAMNSRIVIGSRDNAEMTGKNRAGQPHTFRVAIGSSYTFEEFIRVDPLAAEALPAVYRQRFIFTIEDVEDLFD